MSFLELAGSLGVILVLVVTSYYFKPKLGLSICITYVLIFSFLMNESLFWTLLDVFFVIIFWFIARWHWKIKY